MILRKQNGFTLLELMLVVTLTGLLLMSTPFLSRMLLQIEVTTVANSLTSNLRRAQMFAMSGKQNANWGVYYTSGQLTVYKGNSYVSRDTVFDQDTSINTNVDITGITDLNFARPTGIPSATPTISITGGNTSRTISINSEGVVSQ